MEARMDIARDTTSTAAEGLSRSIPPAVVALAVVAVYVCSSALFTTPAMPPGSDVYAFSGPAWLHGLMRWDGGLYAHIAENGYQPFSGPGRPYAFFPLFPALTAALHAALPPLSVAEAGFTLNVTATVAAAVLLDRSLPEWPRRQRLLAIAAVLTVPSAFFVVAFYSEGLFLFASALVLWSVMKPERLAWAPLGVIIGTLDRPLGFLLIILVAAALFRDRRSMRTRVLIGLASCVGLFAIPLIYWRLSGNPIAFATAQDGWTSLRTLGSDPIRWIVSQLNPWTTSDPVILFSYWEVLLVGIPLVLYSWRRSRAVAVYGASALLANAFLGNVGAQSRYLAMLVPLWITAVVVFHEKAPRSWFRVVGVGVVLGLGFNIWLISRFAAWTWAG